jgi:chloramphenicol-sensitive protein RarD
MVNASLPAKNRCVFRLPRRDQRGVSGRRIFLGDLAGVHRLPTYFVVRKRLATDNLGGLWLDMSLTLPVAFWFVQSGEQGFNVFDQHPWLSLLIPLLGVISASALVVYIIASRLLPFSLFGLLSYVEPVLLLGVALLLGKASRPANG